MRIRFDEPTNKIIVDLEGAVLVVKDFLKTDIDPTMTECECTPQVEFTNVKTVDVDKITWAKLIFNREVKDILKGVY